MKSRTIYIYQDDLFESMHGAPCTILRRKCGAGNIYIEVDFLFSKNTFFCFPKDLKIATPAMTAALERADEIYTKSKQLKKIIDDIDGEE